MAITGNGYGNTLNGTGYGDEIFGYGGDDQLNGFEGSDTLYGGSGNDTMAGGNGDDVFIVDASGDVTSDETAGGAGGTDTVRSSVSYTLSPAIENLVFVGTGSLNGYGNDLANHLTANDFGNGLFGGEGNDTLTGGGSNDVLDGGNGDDLMTGGLGGDTYKVNSLGDAVGVEGLDGGTDTVYSSVTFALGSNYEDLVLTGGTADGYGNDLANRINGNDYGNFLDGAGGNDTLTGGYGGDTLVGGAGDDEYQIIGLQDVAIEAANEGTDTVYSVGSFRLGANLENLNIESGTGTGNGLANMIFSQGGAVRLAGLGGNDTLAGGYGTDDALLGGAGNDNLNGLTGNDIMIGGAGNDAYTVNQAGDQVVESTGHGNDTVSSAVGYTLGANVENLVLLSSAVFGMGNDGANSITGNGANNLLGGGLGSDSLFGGYGNDLIDGSDGNDLLSGGQDADLMIGGAGDDLFLVDDAYDITAEDAGDGTDKVASSITWTLDDNVEQLQLTGGDSISGTGNALANTITGNEAANQLDGKGGADTMIGGNGDDSYYVNAAGDVVTEAASGGENDMVLSSINYTLGANLEDLILTGNGGISGTGNAFGNLIVGNGGANALTGGNGHDTMLGGLGADSFRYAGTLANAHSDTINDFSHGTDHLDLDDALFTAIGAVGNLAAGAFKAAANITATGGNTVDASDRILYDTDSGNVYYDADGSGAGARVLIFTLSESPTLTATDIRVI